MILALPPFNQFNQFKMSKPTNLITVHDALNAKHAGDQNEPSIPVKTPYQFDLVQAGNVKSLVPCHFRMVQEQNPMVQLHFHMVQNQNHMVQNQKLPVQSEN